MTAAGNVTDSVVGTHDAVAISLTDNAARKVNALISEEGNPDLKLRVFVTGGGCSGFQYGFSFDEAVNDDDTVIGNNGAELLVPLKLPVSGWFYC